MNIKDKASRLKQLLGDPLLKEALQSIRDDQIMIFTNEQSSMETIKEAHDIICALNKIDQYFNTVLTDEVMFDKRQGD